MRSPDRRGWRVAAAPFLRDPLRATLVLLAGERAPAADYHPADAGILAAWSDVRTACSVEPQAARRHLGEFVRRHIDDLRDLVRRARDGHGPGPLLDDIAGHLAAALRVRP